MIRIAALAQTGGLGNPMAILLLPILLAILVGGPLLALAGILLAWWRRDEAFWAATAPRWLGLYALAANTAFIQYLVATSTGAPPPLFEWPARAAMVLGLVAMALGVARLIAARPGRRRAIPWLIVIVSLASVAATAERESRRRQAYEDIIDAAREGDLATVQAAIDSGLGEPTRVRILAESIQSWNPQPRVAELLLRAGVSPHATDDRGRSLWREVAFMGKIDLIRPFLAHGADPNATWEGTTPASLAWSSGDAELLDLLRSAGARDADVHEAGFQSVVQAARAGDVDRVRALREAGAQWTRSGPGGEAAVVAAAEEGHGAVVALLLERAGADGSGRAADALIAAAGRGHAKLVLQLLDAYTWERYAARRAEAAADAADAAGHEDIARLIRSRLK